MFLFSLFSPKMSAVRGFPNAGSYIKRHKLPHKYSVLY